MLDVLAMLEGRIPQPRACLAGERGRSILYTEAWDDSNAPKPLTFPLRTTVRQIFADLQSEYMDAAETILALTAE